MTQCCCQAIHLWSNQISPEGSTFPPPGFFPPTSVSLRSPSFIQSDMSCSCLDFTVWNPNMRTEKGGDEGAREQDSAAREAHKQTDSWVWRCHSRLRSYAGSLLFCHFSYGEMDILFGGAAEHSLHSGMSEVTIPCKITQHIHSKPEHKTDFVCFSMTTSWFKFTADDHTVAKLLLQCSTHVSA